MPLQINFSAILVCAVLNMVLGFFWYTVIFSKVWMNLMGFTPERMSDPAAQEKAVHGYFVTFFSCVVMALVLNYFIVLSGTSTALGGLKLGIFCWVGFTLTTMLPYHYFSMKPLKLAAINISYPLVGLSMMGVILSVWR